MINADRPRNKMMHCVWYRYLPQTITYNQRTPNDQPDESPYFFDLIKNRLGRITIGDILLEVLFLQTVIERNACNGPQLVNVGSISSEEESSSHMKSVLYFDGGWQSTGLAKQSRCIYDGDRPMGWAKHHGLGSHRD